MNDITALMATMKAAAEKATPGIWEMEQENIWFFRDGYTKHLMHVTQGDDVDDQQDHINTQYIAEVSPANVLALVEALEKAQQRIAELEGSLGVLEEVYISAADEVSELESRTVTVKLPPRVDSSNVPFTAHTWNCCLDAVEKCLAAAGIQVIEGEQKNG